jgi:hypothetical protein
MDGPGLSDDSRALLDALYQRAKTSEERRRIDLAWTDYEIALGRGERATFLDVAMRRRLVTLAEGRELILTAGTGASTTGVVGLARPPRWKKAVKLYGGALAILVAFVVATQVKIGLPHASDAKTPDADTETRRVESFEHALKVALREGVGGDTTVADDELRLATSLARSPAERSRIDDVREKIRDANAVPEIPVTPRPETPRPPPPPVAPPELPLPLAPTTTPIETPRTPPEAARVEPTLLPEESDAVAYAVSELLKVARFCSKNKAYHEARAELDTALALDPASSECQRELDGLGDLASDPTRYFKDNGDKERASGNAHAANRLADLALSFKKKGDLERWERWLDVVKDRFPAATTEIALTRIGLVYFEPYLLWTDPASAKRLEAGQEQVEGDWKDASAVAELDKRHSSWNDPWILDDGVHELRTTVSLRLAKKLLAQVGAYRRFFLRQFSRSWDLRAPQGKLPVILCRNQADYRQEIDAFAKERGSPIVPPSNAAAFYLGSERALDPCFVTLEAVTLDGAILRFGWDNLLLVLKHELTHQIATEYSRHDRGDVAGDRHYWSVEAIANFMCFYEVDRGHWHLRKPRTIPTRSEGTYEVSPFQWCQENLDSLPRLKDYFATPRADFMSEKCYAMATLSAYFLLFGEHGKYRPGFIRLLERVHKKRCDEKTFGECFPDLDFAVLQRQFIRFVAQVKLDD